MNAPLPAATAFAVWPASGDSHFRLHVFGAVLAWLAPAVRHAGGVEALWARHGFLQDYIEEMAQPGMERLGLDDCWRWWMDALSAWAEQHRPAGPVASLQQALGLDGRQLSLLFQVALVEDDPRFGQLAADLQGGARRPCHGWLAACHPALAPDSVRAVLALLLEQGLLAAGDPGPRSEWPLRVPLPVWDALAALPPQRQGAGTWSEAETLAPLPGLHAPPAPAGDAGWVALRGLPSSGRRTVAGAWARASGRGLLRLPLASSPAELREAGVVACLRQAALALDGRQAGAEALAGLPALLAVEMLAPGPHYLLLPPAGGELPPGTPVLACDVPPPERREALLGGHAGSGAHRLPAGRCVALARAVAGEPEPAKALARAVAALSHPSLDQLAERLPAEGDWAELALPAVAAEELRTLELRCRWRERLAEGVGASLARGLNAGVRALFTGPSGTGKTAAARILAARLGKPAFRVDLARTVSKYIGETEANLARLFDAAEAIDAVLVLDEGDALMAGRTGVANANDRYANLETNFLLQAVERYHGILLITTNAAERIDGAFVRRIDVAIDFPAPDIAARRAILQLHLPARHAVDEDTLALLAGRCALSGGQWRNAVLHAALLALEAAQPLSAGHLVAAVRREYRKGGQTCPLRDEPAS
jgi:hypothetical protein